MPSPAAYTTLVDTETLFRHLDDPRWLVLDCRFSLADPDAGRRRFLESRLPGARYVDLERDLSGPVVPGVTGRHPLPDMTVLTARLAALGVDTASQVVAYDASVGAMAARLWWLMRRLGHERCAVLDGGFPAWQTAGLPLETGVPDEREMPGDLQAGLPLVASVDIERVAAGGLRLLDARERTRFSGEHEPIDPVSGHIPGASNHPFTDNVDADGRFLAPSALRERFAASLGVAATAERGILSGERNRTSDSAVDTSERSEKLPDVPDVPLVHYCGSGVTAAHNVLAMTHAGLDAGALYAGSFSEWITRHEVETDTQR